jgi:hypothetical protein
MQKPITNQTPSINCTEVVLVSSREAHVGFASDTMQGAQPHQYGDRGSSFQPDRSACPYIEHFSTHVLWSVS